MRYVTRCTEELQSCARFELTVSGSAAIYTVDPNALSTPVKSVIIVLGLWTTNLPRGCLIHFSLVQ